KQLLFNKLKEGESMNEYLNTFLGIVDKLLEMDIHVSNDLLAILLLHSVPDSYDVFRYAIEARDIH
ncbi:hypothetical protein WH47_04907, partial [Habropoda laboriosa]